MPTASCSLSKNLTASSGVLPDAPPHCVPGSPEIAERIELVRAASASATGCRGRVGPARHAVAGRAPPAERRREARHRTVAHGGAQPRHRPLALPSSRRSRSTCSDCSAHLLCRCAVLPGCATSAWCVLSHCAHTRARPRCCHRPTTRRRSKSSRARCCAVCIAPSAHFDCIASCRCRAFTAAASAPCDQRASARASTAAPREHDRADEQCRRKFWTPLAVQRPRVVLVQRLADGARAAGSRPSGGEPAAPDLRESLSILRCTLMSWCASASLRETWCRASWLSMIALVSAALVVGRARARRTA